MQKENFHKPTLTWLLKENVNYSVPFDFLEHSFEKTARKEGFITDKERIELKSFQVDEDNRLIHLNTDILRLAEN